MKNVLIKLRNSIIGFLYQKIVKPHCFKKDPEKVHDDITKFGKFLGSNPLTRLKTKCLFGYKNKKLEQTILGIKFPNPVGLAAGFDKNAELTAILPATGFGFIEVGSITGEPCEGNPKPRLWRLPDFRSLRVWYGLKNNGSEEISQRLSNKKFKIPIGISIAKTNCAQTVETQAGINDYLKAYQAFKKIGDYYTINISCPNVFGGQPFTDPDKLDTLLEAITKLPKTKPIFIKLSPDLPTEQIDIIIEIAKQYKIDGFICTNLLKKHDLEEKKGGLSGKIVEEKSNKLIKYIYSKTDGSFVIIGVGGIFSAKDAYQKLKAGASLVQLITGMIYEGPQLISEINRGLIELLEKDGYTNISEIKR